jgi:hypothetical protein
MIASFALLAFRYLGDQQRGRFRGNADRSFNVKCLGKTVTKRLIMIWKSLYQRRIQNGENQSLPLAVPFEGLKTTDDF